MTKSEKKNIKFYSSPAKSAPIMDNLSANTTCQGINVTLDNNNMWNEFFRCQTEMILTKEGNRMFPYCRFRISGLEPAKKYSLVMDIQPLDNSRYKWTGQDWQVAGKGACHVNSQPFAHPDSPSTGEYWMQNPVSFYKLKLTNVTDQEGNIVLHPLHRYLPRLHMVPFEKSKKDLNLNGGQAVTFTFPQTEFFAVTAYQNLQFAQLKVGYNPFSKGIKDNGSNLLALKLKSKDSHNDENSSTNQQHPMKRSLKSLLANHKPRSSKVVDQMHPISDALKDTPKLKYESAANASEKPSCNARPAQKLFSELIREAHVSLRRCNLEQMTVSTSSSKKTDAKEEVVNPQTVDPASTSPTVSIGKSSGTSKASLTPSPASDSRTKPDAQPEDTVRPHKRPVPVPLPALARFLKQHHSKHRSVKTKQDSPTTLPLEILNPPSNSTSPSINQPNPPTGTIKDPKVRSRSSSPIDAGLCYVRLLSNEAETVVLGSSSSGQGTVSPLDPQGPRTDSSVLESSNQPFSTPMQTQSTTCTSATFSASEPADTVLAHAALPQTQTFTGANCASHSQPVLEPAFELDSSSIVFEPLSPASSPDPLPPLPASLDLETCHSPLKAAVSESEDSALKWHTVLPLPDLFLTTFTSFPPAPQPPPLPSSVSTLMAAPASSPSLSQPLATSEPPLSPDPNPSFHDDQSLPFPAELSPLAFHLTLSPTFSGFDGDALSPTPSLSELMHFISTDDNLEIEAGFPKTEPILACQLPNTVTADVPEPYQAPPEPATRPVKFKKRSRKGNTGRPTPAPNQEDVSYTNMKPNLEEVEEQLFVSFTSKEALKLHLGDPSEEPVIPTQPRESSSALPQEAMQQTDEVEHTESLEERIAAFQKVLLRDLKLMKHRQVIHPVLQEVGLKLNLLDPMLAIDLQYLGVCLPIPLPGAPLEAPVEPPAPTPSVSFVSRTGKTADITQIKGWRDKFAPSESSSSSLSSKPEAGVSSDAPSKNLSAFCSDMLDEYLENEAKLLDQRSDSVSQTAQPAVAYKLPTQSTSYVRTLGSVLQKQTLSTPTSVLISSFVPPSKRPKAAPRELKKSREKRQKNEGSKQNKSKPGDSSSLPVPAPAPSLPTATPNPKTLQSPPYGDVQTPPSQQAASSITDRSLKRRRKLKAKAASAPPWEDMAPLESDSELVPPREPPPVRRAKPMLTMALLKQRDLEDGVVWEGRPKTCITEERAAIALTSLFTLVGFVRDDPTAPIQLVKRRAPPCLNAFCRLGCVCSSLALRRPTTHCGRPACMFGCSCLRQKVVLLKNLDKEEEQHKTRKRKKRMKMAYVLKEAEDVDHVGRTVQTLWRKKEDPDPEPLYTPNPCSSSTQEIPGDVATAMCSRVRGYGGRKTLHHPQESGGKPTSSRQEAAEPGKEAENLTNSAPPAPPKPSRRLVMVVDCRWPSAEARSQVLTAVCEAMARDQLRLPFWVEGFLITPSMPFSKDGCTYHKVRVTTRGAGPGLTESDVTLGQDAVEDWQREVETDGESEETEAAGGEMERKRRMKMGLPFLSGPSPAGVLLANKMTGGNKLLVEVNGKLYPMAKVQLGRMGALHPANRLAAYLTGRVGSAGRPPSAAPTTKSTVTMVTLLPRPHDQPAPQHRFGSVSSANKSSVLTAAGLMLQHLDSKLVKRFPLSKEDTKTDGQKQARSSVKVGMVTKAPELAPPSSRPLEAAPSNLDLNIIYVDEEMERRLLEQKREEEYTSQHSEDDSVDSVKRSILNALERKRRHDTSRSFHRLREKLGLTNRRTSKISILHKALQEVDNLRKTEKRLQKKKDILRREGEKHTLLLDTAGRSDAVTQKGEQRSQTGSDIVVLTSDEDDNVSESVDIETVEQRPDRKEVTPPGRRGYAGFKRLRSVLKLKTGSRCEVLDQACRLVSQLTEEEQRLLRVKEDLMKQRSSFIHRISTSSGKAEAQILKKLQNICTTHRRLQEAQRRPAAKRPRGGARVGAAKLSALPLTPPCPAQTQNGKPDTQTWGSGVPAPGGVPPNPSHNALGTRDGTRTVPNILSRRKPSAPPAAPETPQLPLYPRNILPLPPALPGKRLLTLSPRTPPPTVPKTSSTPGVASVLLNVSDPSNQSAPPGSRLRPEPGSMYRAATTLTGPTAHHPASCFPTVLYLVPPRPPQEAAPPPLASQTPPTPQQPPPGTPPSSTQTAGQLEDQLDTSHFPDPPEDLSGSRVGCDEPHYPQCTSRGGALPPLLQMKVGGAKPAEQTDERLDVCLEGVAWRPMPRLVPLGVKGAPPT